jgi:hypothetical protein
VSARHQVKRLDRIFERLVLSQTGPAEETSFLRSVRIPRGSQFHRAAKPDLKFGPDVFADALVALPVRTMPGDRESPNFQNPFLKNFAFERRASLKRVAFWRRGSRTAGRYLHPCG